MGEDVGALAVAGPWRGSSNESGMMILVVVRGHPLESFSILCDLEEQGALMKSKKKSKKAVTLLTRIEKSLSDVLDDFSVIDKSAEKNIREVLLSAQKSIVSAIDFISSLPSSEVRKKAVKSRKLGRRHLAKSTAKLKKRALRA